MFKILNPVIDPEDIEKSDVDKALDIIESPWERRDEKDLREWFSSEYETKEKSFFVIKNVLKSGIEPFISPDPLPPIKKDDINLIVWMAVSPS